MAANSPNGLKISEEQLQQLGQFKRNLEIPEQGIPQDSGIQDDTTLIRFLSGKKWDMEAAVEQYKAMVQWRKDFEVDEIFEWEKENPDRIEEIKSMYPSCHYGFDKEGRPLVVNRIGLIPCAVFAEKIGRVEWKKYHVLFFEKLMNICREQTKKLQKPITQITVIVDAEGCSFQHRHFTPYFKSNAGIDKQNYPEFLYSVTVVNAPWIFPTLFNFVKGFIDPNTREKIQFFSSDFQDRLLELMDSKNLAKEYGGECDTPLPVPDVKSCEDADPDGLMAQKVSMMDSFILVKECDDEKGGRYAWLFRVEQYNINFKVEWREKGSEEWTVVEDLKNVETHESSFSTDSTGELRLTFDNTYSYFTSKNVKYALLLHPRGTESIETSRKKTNEESIKVHSLDDILHTEEEESPTQCDNNDDDIKKSTSSDDIKSTNAPQGQQ